MNEEEEEDLNEEDLNEEEKEDSNEEEYSNKRENYDYPDNNQYITIIPRNDPQNPFKMKVPQDETLSYNKESVSQS